LLDENILDEQTELLIPTLLPSKDEEIKSSFNHEKESGGISRGNKKYFYSGVNRMTS
jgi:hypothetical protein